MDNSNTIVSPHLNAEVYRTDTTGTDTISHLEYIRFHPSGSVLIGCSELTGRYWNGGAVLDSQINLKKTQSCTKKTINLRSGTADGCFINSSDRVLLCEDFGTVSIWKYSSVEKNSWQQWTEEVSVSEHDDAALAVDCLSPGKEYVTVGADGNIKIWDVNEMICMKNYLAAHSSLIYGVSVRPKSTTNFATGSCDHYISLWDENVDKPVLDVVKNDYGIRCLQWMDENYIIYGDEAGGLSLVDIRNPKSTIKLTGFPAAIHKLEINSEQSKVAVCCDNKIVSVCDIRDKTSVILKYHDRHMHNNYVRGLAWDLKDSTKLYSIGWDGLVIMHTV